MTRLALRPFEPADDGELIGWFEDADALRRFAGNSLRWPLQSTQLDGIRRSARLQPLTAYVPPAVDRAVGHIEIVDLADRAAVRLARVAIAPELRGRGLGREMLSLALERARDGGARSVDLYVFDFNAPARTLYESLGFRHVGADPSDPSSLHLRRELERSGALTS